MRRAAETANLYPGAPPPPAVAECARVVNRDGAFDGTATVAGPGAVVQMVGAGRRVLDFGEGRDEVCKIEDVFLELGGKVEEAEGCCGGC